VALSLGAQSESTTIGIINTVGGYMFSFFVFLMIVLLGLHAMQFIGIQPNQLVSWFAIGLAFIITTTGALWANSFRVSEIEIPLEGLKQDVVAMHISDVHIGHQRGKDYLEKIVKETNERNPDMVLITGDLVDANAALLPDILSPLKDFHAPVYFVGGNHENYIDTERAFGMIEKYNVNILQNEAVEIHGINLVGLSYMNPDDNTFDMHPSDDKRTIENVLPTIVINDHKPSVLMHHSPVGAQYVSEKGIDLMLSGHTHGGQMFPSTLFAPFIFPFNKGLYNEGDTKVFVSQGAGTFGPRIRLGNSNEINLIRLKAIH
jgi:predicted MPP superfamily phosphohydrolase